MVKAASATKVRGGDRAIRGRNGAYMSVDEIRSTLKDGIILCVYQIRSWIDGVRKDTEILVL